MWLSDDEQIIIKYLEQCGEKGASAREICRKAGSKDKWKENERWAMPPLSALKEKKLILTDASGCFRVPEKKKFSVMNPGG